MATRSNRRNGKKTQKAQIAKKRAYREALDRRRNKVPKDQRHTMRGA